MEVTNEIYRDVKGYEGLYQVSNFGNVKSLERTVSRRGIGSLPLKEKLLKYYLETSGYYTCTLSKDNKSKTFSVHKLVAMAFLNHLPNYYILVINHIDGNKTNNCSFNLEEVTPMQNVTECYMPSKSTHKRTYASCYKSIQFRKSRNKWFVQIKINGKRKSLGSFSSESDAILKLKEYEDREIFYIK